MQYLSSCHYIYTALQFFIQLQFAFEIMYIKYFCPVTDLGRALMYNG